MVIDGIVGNYAYKFQVGHSEDTLLALISFTLYLFEQSTQGKDCQARVCS